MSYLEQKNVNDKINFVIHHFMKKKQHAKLRTICKYLSTVDIIHLMLVNHAFRLLLSKHEKSKLPYFIVQQAEYSNGYKNEEFREIIQDRYASDRATFEEITGVEFATNAANNSKNNSNNSSDDEDEEESDSSSAEDDGKDDNKDENEKDAPPRPRQTSVVDELLGKSANDEDDDKKLELSIFKDELGTLDFQMIKWMLCTPYERTFWGYVIKYQKLLIEQYMLVEPKVIHEDHTQPFVSCLANVHDLDFNRIEKTNEKYKVYESMIMGNNVTRGLSSIDGSDEHNEDNNNDKNENTKDKKNGKLEANTKLSGYLLYVTCTRNVFFFFFFCFVDIIYCFFLCVVGVIVVVLLY